VTLAPRVVTYTTLGAVALLAGLIASEPAAVAMGAAFLVPVVYALAAQRPSLPESAVELPLERLLEGDTVEMRVELQAPESIDWLELELVVPSRARLVTGGARRVVKLGAGERRTFVFGVAYPRWGAYPADALRLTGRHRLFMIEADATRDATRILRVYPSLQRLRRLVPPLATRPASGARPARIGGEGIEFAEIRAFRAGERLRRINWRASARHGELLVTDRHPERSSDVVVFLDSLTEAADDQGSTLDLSVRAVATVASAYLERRDRVGLLSFGGDLEWILPSAGPRQLYRIVEAVLASESGRLYRWRDPRLIPRRVLPPQSLVVAVTSLLDWRVTRALLDLRARGYDLAILEIDPIAFAAGTSARHDPQAWRLWLLERELLHHAFAKAGVPIAAWDGERPLARSVEELASTR